MKEILEQYIPNIMEKLPDFYESIVETLIMLFWSGSISFILGLLFGIILVVTRPRGILNQPVLFHITDKVINFFRSIPFIILLAALFPLTRAIAGTAIGVKGAIVPLVFGTVPFFSRQIETALLELDGGIIEAAQAMGLSPWQIITGVYLKESIPAIARGTTITAISLIGLIAMAGAVGAGGLGDFAIRFGHQRHQLDVTYTVVVVLVLLVSLIQQLGNFIAKKTKH